MTGTPRPRVAIVLDNPMRDLSAIALLSWVLTEAGCECIIVPMNRQSPELAAIQPDFVLFNYLRETNHMLMADLMHLGVGVIVLDTEGIAFEELPAGALQPSMSPQSNASTNTFAATLLTTDPLVRQRIAGYCAWSPFLAAALVREGWYRKDQLFITGSIRTDLFTNYWRPVARELSGSYASSMPTPLVLISGGFAISHPEFQTAQAEREMMVNRFGFDDDYVVDYQESLREAFNEFVNLSLYLARCFPDITFLYRPHPFESELPYREHFASISNLHLSKQGTIDSWLVKACALIHYNSSTSLEARIVGVPVLAPTWIRSVNRIEAFELASISCPDLDTLARRVEEAAAGKSPLPTNEETIQRILFDAYGVIDGQAHRRVANVVIDLMNSIPLTQKRNFNKRFVYSVYRRLRDAVREIRLGGLGRLAPLLRGQLAWDSTNKVFTAEELQVIIDLVANHQQTNHAPQVLTAQAAGAYRPQYRNGRSIVVRPATAPD